MNLVPISVHEEREVRLASRTTSRTPETEFSRVLSGAVSKTNARATHTVQPGESLWKICASHLEQGAATPSHQQVQQAVTSVAKENALADPDMIHVGQVLKLSSLPGSAIGNASVSPAPPLVPRPVANGNSGTGGPDTTRGVKRLAVSDEPLRHAHPELLQRSSGTTLSVQRHTAARSVPLQQHAAKHVALNQPTRADVRDSRKVSSDDQPRDGTVKVSAPSRRGDLVNRIRAILSGKHVARRVERSSTAWPALLDGFAEVSSAFGMRKDPFTRRLQFHEGIDLAVDSGTRIYPLKAGRVVFSGRQAGYGNVVVVRHDDDTETVYGHNKVNLARVGQHVTADTPLGLSGSTGRSTGPHLHFEVRVNDRAVDPMPFLEPRSFQVAKAF